jgi:hypothetical protein
MKIRGPTTAIFIETHSSLHSGWPIRKAVMVCIRVARLTCLISGKRDRDWNHKNASVILNPIYFLPEAPDIMVPVPFSRGVQLEFASLCVYIHFSAKVRSNYIQRLHDIVWYIRITENKHYIFTYRNTEIKHISWYMLIMSQFHIEGRTGNRQHMETAL